MILVDDLIEYRNRQGRTWGGDDCHPANGGMWFTGEGQCQICGARSGDRLLTDHCHTTGLVRGLLCNSCNTLEGCGGPDWMNLWRLMPPAWDGIPADREIYAGWGRSIPLGPLNTDYRQHGEAAALFTLPLSHLLYAQCRYESIVREERAARTAAAMSSILGAVLARQS